MKKNNKVILMLIIVIILLILDQALKIYCLKYKNIETEKILPGTSLTYEESNKGAFGVGQNSVVTYIISTCVVLGVVLKFFLGQIDRINVGIVIGISMVLAGGLSNMIDKIVYGFVINCIQLLNLPSINLSYIVILLAWIELAAIFAFNIWKETRKKDA